MFGVKLDSEPLPGKGVRAHKGHAFTLVELLTVVAILSILMAIFGVVLGRAESDAKKSACMFNMRQMGVGMGMYVIDNDDHFPQTKGHSTNRPQIDDADGSIESPDRGSPLRFLTKYGVGIPDCPADRNTDNSICSQAVNSYVVNGYFVWGLAEGDIRIPESTVYLAERRSQAYRLVPEYCGVIYHPWYNTGNLSAPNNDMDEFAGAFAERHFDGSNYLFADGHASWKTFGQTWGPGVDLHTP